MESNEDFLSLILILESPGIELLAMAGDFKLPNLPKRVGMCGHVIRSS